MCFIKVGQESQLLLSCAENRHRGDCESARGLGTTTGRCQWRQGSNKGIFYFFEMASQIYFMNEQIAVILEHMNHTERTRQVIVMIFLVPGISKNYSTCSPDLRTCPDRVCDAVESKDASICPQDCTSKTNLNISTLMQGTCEYGR